MEINPTDSPTTLVKTNIVKPLKARSRNRFDPMIRNQKVLFPSHEQVLALVESVHVGGDLRWSFLGGFCERSPGGETGPVLHVDFFGGAPGGVICAEEVLWANDLAFEEGC